MGSRFYTLLALILLSAAAAEAYTINNINLVVDEAGTVQVEEKLIVYSGETEVRLGVPSNHESLKVLSGGIPLDFRVVEAGEGVEVVSPVDTGLARSVGVNVLYTSRQLTGKSGGVWTLSFPARIDPYRTIISVTLPRNTTILDWEPKTRFTPTADGLFVYPENEEYNLVLNYVVGGSAGRGVPNSYFYVGSFLLLLAVFVIYRRRKASKDVSTDIVISPPPVEVVAETPRTPELGEDSTVEDDAAGVGGRMKDSVYQMLEENERKIVDVLLSKDEDITQAQICREAGVPKATLSDLMRRLEKRNVVERERDGRRNWVKLKKWVFK